MKIKIRDRISFLLVMVNFILKIYINKDSLKDTIKIVIGCLLVLNYLVFQFSNRLFTRRDIFKQMLNIFFIIVIVFIFIIDLWVDIKYVPTKHFPWWQKESPRWPISLTNEMIMVIYDSLFVLVYYF